MIELLEHNKPTYDELCEKLESHNKVALIQATGTGKSYIIGKYLEEHKGKSLILVPTNAIGDQWEKLLNGTGCDFTIDTYQGMSTHIDDEANYDIVVADEMHHLGSDVWGNAFINLFMQTAAQKVIGTTATEIRYLDNSRDMVEELFGGVAARGCDLRTAIEKEILPTFTYVSVWYGNDKDYEEYTIKARKIRDNTIKKQMLGKLEMCKQNQKSIEQAIEENLSNDSHKIIVFMNGVDSMDKAEKNIKKAFSAKKTYKINSTMKKGAISRNIAEFENDNDRTAVLFAIDMLNEGVHIDGVDTVAFFRTTESPAIYFQQLGRCLAVSKVDSKRTVFDFVCNSQNIKSLYSDNETKEKGFINRLNSKLPNERKIIIQNYIKEQDELFSEIQNYISSTWSDEEIQFIKEHSFLTSKELGDALNRTEVAVRLFCYRNNLDFKRNAMTKGMKEKIKALGNTEDMGYIEIAEMLGELPSKVYRCLHKNNIPYRKSNNHYFTKSEDKLIEENLDKGREWLAKKIGVSVASIDYRVRKMGYKVENIHSLSDDTKVVIRRMAKDGYTAKEIAESTERSLSSIYHFAERENLEIKKNLHNDKLKKPIVMYDKNGRKIKEFESITNAADYIGKSPGSISNCLRGKCKTAYGYVYKYK